VTPEQLALYAPGRGLSRNDLPMAAQLEYDRLRPAWERGEALPVWDREAARLAWEAQHPPEAPDRRGAVTTSAPWLGSSFSVPRGR
jgi:hypothetical protein